MIIITHYVNELNFDEFMTRIHIGDVSMQLQIHIDEPLHGLYHKYPDHHKLSKELAFPFILLWHARTVF